MYACTHASACMYVYVCMYVCMHACMHACIYVCLYVCRYVRTCVLAYVRTDVCLPVCLFVCLSDVTIYACMCVMYMYVCMHACVCVYYLHVYIYVLTHIYAHPNTLVYTIVQANEQTYACTVDATCVCSPRRIDAYVSARVHAYLLCTREKTLVHNDGGALQIHGHCPGAGIESLRLDNHTADLHSQSPVAAVSCGYSLQNWRVFQFHQRFNGL